MKILIVEDQKSTAASLGQGLRELNFDVDLAYDGLTGNELAMSSAYDVIVTDIIMPGINGIELCKNIRNRGMSTPILMLSALDSKEEIIHGLESGGDDYLTKPFEFRELVARIKALGRRRVNDDNNKIVIGDLHIDIGSKQVKRNGVRIDLTPKEFRLLEYLVRNRGHVVTKTDIIKNVWEIEFDPGTNVVEVYINYLRKKIDKDSEDRLIQTRFGVGYIIEN
ncbi:MAG: response regulator transcription factor [Saprospiraceae bacterium]|nr:response regulator transcription factor [Saprospiraceae bacterium]